MPHAGYGDLLGGQNLCDFWWVICRMARLQYGAKISPKKIYLMSRVHARHRRLIDDRQTDLR